MREQSSSSSSRAPLPIGLLYAVAAVAAVLWMLATIADLSGARQAAYYRKLAAQETSLAVAQRMLDFAKHYDALAELMAEADAPVPPVQHMPMQQGARPVQQQQAKIEPEDKE